MASRTNLSKHWCAQFLWSGAPYIIAALSNGVTFSTSIVVVLVVLSICNELFSRGGADAAAMLQSSRTERFISFSLPVIIVISLFMERKQTLESFSTIGRAEAKSIILIVTFFILIFLLIRRGIANNADSWTYALEKRLLIGLCSNQGAIEEIESHSLGSRLLRVIEVRRNSLLDAERNIQIILRKTKDGVSKIEKISQDYTHERKAQFQHLSTPLKNELIRFEKSIKAFREFNEKLAYRNKQLKDARIEKLTIELSTEIARFRTQGASFRNDLESWERGLLLSDVTNISNQQGPSIIS
jgi:hypothetical protein